MAGARADGEASELLRRSSGTYRFGRLCEAAADDAGRHREERTEG